MPSEKKPSRKQQLQAATDLARRSQLTNPDHMLNEALSITDAILDVDSEHMDLGEALRLAELVDALDTLIANGGALPARWAQKPVPVQP
jgi:hypothetical protein